MTKTIAQLTSAALPLDPDSLVEVSIPGGGSRKATLFSVKTAFDGITTGASPTAADPETDVTYVTTGGTAGVEIITLALPSDPETKIGKLKRIVLSANGDSGDLLDFDATNIVDANGDSLNVADWLQNEIAGIGSFLSLRLIYQPNMAAYRWQISDLNAFGFEVNIFARYVYPLPNISVGSPLSILGGYSKNGAGGLLTLSGGDSTNAAGGNTRVRSGSGDSDGGDILLEPGSGNSGRNGAIIPTLGSFADDAAAATGGVPVGGLYRTASAVKVRAA